MSGRSYLYPNVTSLPVQSDPGVSPGSGLGRKPAGQISEFDRAFDQAVSEGKGDIKDKPDLGQIRSPLRFSSHASQRLRDRKIALDPATLSKINDAVDKADAKGVQDTLILTANAALIVNVTNRTVVTALDRNAASGNVFTNIDGAVIV